MRVIVIGAGMSGILCAIRLQEAGIDDYSVYEKGETIGGTWRDNTYPGLTCDVPSHIYCYSFETNPEWSHRFSPGPEIQRYFEGVARKYGVLDTIECGREATRCQRVDGRWRVGFADGAVDEADFVILATGVLHHPNLPDFAGLESFGGAAFHSARWDHSVPLEGRRIGIVGTGSTAVQITTALIDRVGALSLFQRTAQWVMPATNAAYSDEEKALYRDDDEALESLRRELNKAFAGTFSNALTDADSEGVHAIEQMCRRHLEERVRDPELRERLRPSYRAACKRLIVADGFYEALQQPHATLVTETIERVEEKGVRTRDGTLHELDVLVLATGFRAHDFMRPMQVVGPGGRTLEEAWKPVPRAYRSVSMPGFPNFFLVVGPHSPIGNFSVIDTAELQVGYILQLIEAVRSGRGREICATPEATDRFNQEIRDAMGGTIWSTGCRSWYLDANGVPATWPWTVARFHADMQRPDLADFELG